MFDLKSLIQTTLDTALYPNVYVYLQRKSGADADEYVVYTRSGDNNVVYADDVPLTKDASITVKYYYRSDKIGTKAGRTLVNNREDTILNALESAGFDVSGPFDAGDVDDIGFYTSVFEISYSRVV